MARRAGRAGRAGRALVVLRPLGLFAVSRVVVLLAMAATVALVPSVPFARALAAWDGGWYLDIARHGYPAHVAHGLAGNGAQDSTAFYPLFPMLVRGLMRLSGWTALRAGVVVATAASAAAVTVVWLFVRRIANVGVADRAVALLCFFPAAFVLSMPFSEGVMLLCASACLYLLFDRRWIAAGLAGAAASATRPTGIACAFACAVAAALAIRYRREWRALVAPVLAPLGVVAYFIYLRFHTGDLLASYHSQRFGWHQNVDFGATTIHAIARAFTDPVRNFNNVAVVVALGLALAGALFLVRARMPSFVGAYALAAVVPALMAASIASRPRYVLTAFPLVMAPAWRLRGPVFWSVLALYAGLLAITTMLTVSMTWLTA